MVLKKIILPLALMATLVSCKPETGTVTKAGTDTTANSIEVISDYGRISENSQSWCKKIRVDGHEYLMFGSGLANPPMIIHNMACPCMGKDIIKSAVSGFEVEMTDDDQYKSIRIDFIPAEILKAE